jgi:riboflavin kinase / FMN adenylyltransferase
MKIYNGIEEFEKLDFAVVTSGSFDGVHLGHQKILEKLANTARDKKGESVLITFWPHPRHVLYPNDKSLKVLTTFDEKAQLLQQAGVDHLIKIPFTRSFSELSSEEFIGSYLIDKINTKVLVIGYDHRFGKNREGSFDHLKDNSSRYGFEVEEIPEQDVDHVAVSSTRIRKALAAGDLELANRYLGRAYSLSGSVVKGNRLGRQLGYPTANIEVENDNKLIPADGIYAVKVRVEGKVYDGMLSIGIRPTIGKSDRTVEVNIFNFNEDVYDKKLTVYFIRKFRDEKKFNDLEELKQQLHLDLARAKEILAQEQIFRTQQNY